MEVKKSFQFAFRMAGSMQVTILKGFQTEVTKTTKAVDIADMYVYPTTGTMVSHCRDNVGETLLQQLVSRTTSKDHPT